MRCSICGADQFKCANYTRSSGVTLPALECCGCGALSVSETAATCADERDSIRDVMKMRRELGYTHDTDPPPTERRT